MTKTMLSAAFAMSLAAAPAIAADMPLKAAPPAPPPVTNWWEIAYGGGVMSDYNFRGISQSDRGMAGTFYVEGRANVSPVLQLYGGTAVTSVKLPTDPAAEVDFYGGLRATVGPVTFDVGGIYYYYPKETQIFLDPITGGAIRFPTPFPWTKTDTDFAEVYGKLTYVANDWLTLGAYIYYSPDMLNTGADGTYFGGSVKLTAPSAWFPTDGGAYLSGEVDRYIIGRSDAFFGNVDFPDYTYWNVGVGLTYKVFTLDLRYHDTDLSRTDCFALTGDLRGLPGGGNTLGQSKWCGQAFIAKLSVDATLK
jgi:hypothetical protein